MLCKVHYDVIAFLHWGLPLLRLQVSGPAVQRCSCRHKSVVTGSVFSGKNACVKLQFSWCWGEPKKESLRSISLTFSVVSAGKSTCANVTSKRLNLCLEIDHGKSLKYPFDNTCIALRMNARNLELDKWNPWQLTLTEWKPIPYIFPIRTTVRIGRGQEDRILANYKTRKNPQKNKETRKKLWHEKRGTGDCCDASKADKACERECGRGWSRQKGQGDPACGWAICEWEVSGHVN